MNKDNLEIERKFLLKRIPDFNKNEIKKFLIHQIYVDIDGKINRFRMTEFISPIFEKMQSWVKEFFGGDDITYVQCVKTPLSPGVFKEIENDITKEKFKEMLDKDHRYIIKTRYVYEQGGLKWEIDKYHEVALVTLEVELDDIKQKITIPEIIENEMIVEVTGQKVFSNYSLSLKEGV